VTKASEKKEKNAAPNMTIPARRAMDLVNLTKLQHFA
jgi:hypothetical protein